MIKYIRDDVLCYRNDSGIETFIDLKVCRDNRIEYKRRRNIEIHDSETCVGERDICAKPCYFLFYTKPFTRITFKGFNAKKRFDYWRNQLCEAGWTTFDLS